MADVRVMHWKENPIQVQAVDDKGTIPVPLADRFQQGVAALAMADGNAGTDDYLMSWEWSGYFRVDVTTADAAHTTADRYNSGFPGDFVPRATKVQSSGNRILSPGSVDHWIDSQRAT